MSHTVQRISEGTTRLNASRADGSKVTIETARGGGGGGYYVAGQHQGWRPENNVRKLMVLCTAYARQRALVNTYTSMRCIHF